MSPTARNVLPYTKMAPGERWFSWSTSALSPWLNVPRISFTLSTHLPGGAVALWFGMQPSGPTPAMNTFLRPRLYRVYTIVSK